MATDGTVCAVAYTGAKVGDQWLGSRVISAQKANTANAFSLPGLALSTANLYSPTQPGGSLFGLQFSNPVDTQVAYAGSAADFGTAKDPLVGARIGGVNVFGGGLALYDAKGTRVGALGVSGDCAVLLCERVDDATLAELAAWPARTGVARLAIYAPRPKTLAEQLAARGIEANCYSLLDALLRGPAGGR